MKGSERVEGVGWRVLLIVSWPQVLNRSRPSREAMWQPADQTSCKAAVKCHGQKMRSRESFVELANLCFNFMF